MYEFRILLYMHVVYHDFRKSTEHAETMHYSVSANTSDSFYEFIVFAKRTEICCRLILNSLPCRLFARKKLDRVDRLLQRSRESRMGFKGHCDVIG